MENNYEKRIEKLREISKALSPKKSYHNFLHNEDVSLTAKLYALKEGLSEHEAHLEETAGLVHDIYHNNSKMDEEISGLISILILEYLGYNQSEIGIVQNLVIATKYPTNPHTLLEKIICDADISNCGRDDFWEKSEQLRKERGIKDRKVWYENYQLKFLGSVKFYTKTAKVLLEAKRNEYQRIVEEKAWQSKL